MTLPPFTFQSGYTLECTDMGNAGIKVGLSRGSDEDRAILMPPQQCEMLLNWLRNRCGKRTSAPQKTNTKTPSPLRNKIYRFLFLEQSDLLQKISRDMNILYDIIENDTGVTSEEIENYDYKPKLIVFARDVMCFILRMRFDLSTPKIALIIGAKSHASVLFCIKKFDAIDLQAELYKQSDLLKIYKDAKARYQKTKVF